MGDELPVAIFGGSGRNALELGHWTGHATRLNREDLVAELCSAFLCAELGVTPTLRNAYYLGAWLDVAKGDNRAIVHAASMASMAAEFVMGRSPPV